MKTNKRMDLLLEEIREKHLDDPTSLPPKLLTVIEAGFLQEDDCVFLAAFKQSANPMNRAHLMDCTGHEGFVNHLHIEDYSKKDGLTPLVMVGQGLAFAKVLREKLPSLDARKQFRVIVSSDDKSCTVRFHTLRPEERWIEEDLEGCEDEAIAVLDT